MTINGKWYTEPQLEAYVMALEAKLAEVEAKHELECMQIAHYSDELVKVKEFTKALSEGMKKLAEDLTLSEEYGEQNG